jgi:hypothetical protein
VVHVAAAGAQGCLAPGAWLPRGAVQRFLLHSKQGVDPIGHPSVVFTKALATHTKQLVALPDDLQQETIAWYTQLCDPLPSGATMSMICVRR